MALKVLLETQRKIRVPVSNEMREVEAEIDAKLRSMPLWKCGRATALESLMGIYRDSIELTFVKALRAEILDNPDALQAAFRLEFIVRSGALWALKWATMFCADSELDEPISPNDFMDIILFGNTYDALVDVLKCAEKDLIALSVNQRSKEIICYEGKSATGFDAEIVDHQQALGPTHIHASLTADSDQLTSNWSAGDYRRVVQQLAEFASTQEDQIIVNKDWATTHDGGEISIPQPTIAWLNRPKEQPDVDVFDSLTLPSRVSGKFMWGARSLLEVPIANCAGRFCALSSDLKTIACVSDYMLRMAARNDEEQYSKVSGLREGRMVKACRAAFEESSEAWTVRSHVKLKDPPQEADVVATRSGDSLVIELKSTLRPETLWEVHKRNRDILKGLSQAESLVRRGVGSRGLLITDGYRGDHVCWGEAIKRDVTIGTLSELEHLARDPDRAIRLMKMRAGMPVGEHTFRRLPDRENDLFGWKLRLIDAKY